MTYYNNYRLINALPLPNYNILSIFMDNNGIIIVKHGNFKFFIENQIKINAPGKDLTTEKWIKGKYNDIGIEWENGVSFGEDYLFKHSSQIF